MKPVLGVPLVFVEWEDSAQPTSNWQHLGDYEPQSVVRCVSVGWLIADSKDVKSIAPNMAGLEDENHLQVSGVINIPTRSILRIIHLKEPKLMPCAVPSSRLGSVRKRLVS